MEVSLVVLSVKRMCGAGAAAGTLKL